MAGPGVSAAGPTDTGGVPDAVPPRIDTAGRLRAVRVALTLLWVGPFVWIVQYLLTDRIPSGQSRDFFPFYWGAHAWMVTGNAYDLIAAGVQPETDPNLLLVGTVYPLPGILLFGLPLSWLPPVGASVAYTVVMLAAIGWLAYWSRTGPAVLWWLPTIGALLLSQAALISIVAVMFGWGAHRRDRPWLVAVSCAMLLMKPQEGFLLVLLLAWWHREHWRKIAVVIAAVWLPFFALQPGWVTAWLQVALQRDTLLNVPPMRVTGLIVPAVLLILLAVWWKSRHAGVQRDGYMFVAVNMLQAAFVPWPVPSTYIAGSWLTGLTARAAGCVTVVQFIIVPMLDREDVHQAPLQPILAMLLGTVAYLFLPWDAVRAAFHARPSGIQTVPAGAQE